MRRIVASAALLTSLFFLSMIGLATTTAAPQHDQQLANDHLGQLCKRADRNCDELPPLHLAHPASSALNHELPSDRYFEREMEEEKPEGEGKLQKLLPGIGGSGSEGWGTRRKRTPTTIVGEIKNKMLDQGFKSNQPSSSGPSSTASSSSSSSSSDCSPPSCPMGIFGAQESRRASQKGKGLRGCRKAKENFEHITRFVEESCSGLKSSKKKRKKRGGITVYKLMAEDPEIPQEHKLTEKQYEYRRSKIKKAIDSIKEINPREDSTNAEIEMCLRILEPWDKTEMDRWDSYFAFRKRHRMRGRTKVPGYYVEVKKYREYLATIVRRRRERREQERLDKDWAPQPHDKERHEQVQPKQEHHEQVQPEQEHHEHEQERLERRVKSRTGRRKTPCRRRKVERSP